VESSGVILLVAVFSGMAITTVGVWWWRYVHRKAGSRGDQWEGAQKREPLVPEVSRGLHSALAKTAGLLRERLDRAFAGGENAGDAYEALEEALIAADAGVQMTGIIVKRARARCGASPDSAALRGAVREEVCSILGDGGPIAPSGHPWVIVITGVNGVGKTTTIGKLALRYTTLGKKVLLVAADTFRAAAGDQLQLWAERVGAEIVRHGQGADPSAVVHDGMRAALARGADVVLVDTAGRLHTRTPLMDELRKIHRTIGREIGGAPHETLLVIDATTGQNAVSQARTFGEAVALTGVVLTKLDGTAKGGTALTVAGQQGLPIRYVGVGEGVDDLRPFSASEYASGLVGVAQPGGTSVAGQLGME
jgi:fused signal recognition particle receptor